MLTVAQSIAKTLKAYGTEKFFCLCGGDHELWYALDDEGIEIVNCRSEDAAVYMADGYARMTGKPGFVYGQRGPGVANVAGSLADALWAQESGDLPHIIHFTHVAGPFRIPGARRPSPASGGDQMEQVRVVAGASCGHAARRDPHRAGPGARACAPRRFPADMLDLDAGDEVFCEEEYMTVNSYRQPPDLAALERILEGLSQAKRPLIVAGKGVVISQAWNELTRFAELMSIPVATSLGGKGSIDEAHALSVGVIGRNSRKIGNDSVRECDTVLAIGTRLGGLATHRWTLPFDEKQLFHIDADAHIIGQNFRTQARVVADAKLALSAASKMAEQKGLARGKTDWSASMTERVRQWRGHADRLHIDQKVDGIHPAEVIAALRRNMRPNDIIGADTGAHGSWVGALFPVSAGKTMIRANGSLGWVFPGALGATLAALAGRVVAVTGDGGMLYHIGEFETAIRLRIPTVIVVLNNACLASEYRSRRNRTSA